MKGRRIGEWLIFDVNQVFSQKHIISQIELDSSVEWYIPLRYEQEKLDRELAEYFGGHIPTGLINLFDINEFRDGMRIRTRAYTYMDNCKWIGEEKCESQ